MFYTVALSEWGSEPPASHVLLAHSRPARPCGQQPAKGRQAGAASSWPSLWQASNLVPVHHPMATHYRPGAFLYVVAESGQGPAGSTCGPALTLSCYSSGLWHGAPDRARAGSPAEGCYCVACSPTPGECGSLRGPTSPPLDTIVINPMCSLDLSPTDL